MHAVCGETDGWYDVGQYLGDRCGVTISSTRLYVTLGGGRRSPALWVW
jgi:hypothetical protein